MEKTPPELFIDYEAILQKALLAAVKEILISVETQGLVGDHHYYVHFLTNHPSTMISEALKNEYPEEITIVLQNQFWELKVDDNGFAVRLGFGARFESLYVPFQALLGFTDPIAEFALSFKPDDKKIEPMPMPPSTPTVSDTGKVATLKTPKAKSSPKNTENNSLKTNNVVKLDKFRNTKD